MTKKQLAGKLKRYRRKHKITQAQLAEACGVSLYNINAYEQSLTKPKYINAVKLATILGININEIV